MKIKKPPPHFKSKTSVRAFVYELLSESMITGIPEIVTTTHRCRKFWKIFVLCACLLGFFYQTSSFLSLYWSYPIIVDLNFEYPSKIKLPALTICNFNGLNRKRFCQKNQDKCEPPPNITEFCQRFPHICSFNEDDVLTFVNTVDITYLKAMVYILYVSADSVTPIPKEDYRLLEQNADTETVMEYGQTEEDLIISCKLEIDEEDTQPCPNVYLINLSTDCKEIETIKAMIDTADNVKNVTSFVNFYEDTPRICFTLNARYKMYENLPIIYVSDEISVMTLTLNLRADAYFRPDRPVHAVLSVHSPEQISEPFDDSIVIEQGNSYEVIPTEEITNLLPSPYRTNCTTNSKMPDGQATLEGCIDHCILNTYYKHCKCLRSLTLLPDPRPFCSKEHLPCVEETSVRFCNKKCAHPCRSSTYILETEQYPVNKFNFQEQSLERWMRGDKESEFLTIVKIIIQHPHISIKSHKPKYETVEFFSHIGGYIGIWLGMSLIALFDFIEALIRIANFSCIKLSHKPAKVKKIAVMRHDRIDDFAYEFCIHGKRIRDKRRY